jgi:hypothetical protein
VQLVRRPRISLKLALDLLDSVRIEEVAKDYSRKVRIPGFRPGKVPTRVVKQRFKEQILPVAVRSRKETVSVARDEHIRPDATVEQMAKLRPAFVENGLVTAGNAAGVNDAAALAQADLGIAMGSGTDVAMEAGDAAILNNRIEDVAALVTLSRRTMSVVRQNVTIALGLKAVFLVTTVLGITGLWIAVLADTGATVLVTANALRLLAWSRSAGKRQ